ncbi:thioester reductase domain-containing protein [Nocardia sp. NPDC052566]|uniref:thioester reductase domain-containing protein n=1 Tax=Nocardia sp. NPDC052566 TaxID=3364330 RepID=UPI0037CBD1B8
MVAAARATARTVRPLTAAQLGVWLGQQLDPSSPEFNIAEYVDISGPVSIDSLVAAIRTATAEASALHGRFVETADGPMWIEGAHATGRPRDSSGASSEPGYADRPRDADGPKPLDVQEVWRYAARPMLDAGTIDQAGPVDPAPGCAVEVVDLTGDPDPLGAARARMAADVAVPRALTGSNLFAHIVFRLGDVRTLWYHRVHHILLDGYGMALIARRVADLYTAALAGAPQPPYAFGSWDAVVAADHAYTGSADMDRDRAFWLDYYRKRPVPVSLSGVSKGSARKDGRGLALPESSSPQSGRDRRAVTPQSASIDDAGKDGGAVAAWSGQLAAAGELSGISEVESEGGEWQRPSPSRESLIAGRAVGPLREWMVLEADVVAALRDVGRAARANWTEVLTAAIAAFLHRMTGAAEICLALPVMLRTGSPALRVPCMTLNGIPLWVDFAGAPSLTEATVQVAKHLMRSRRHHRYRSEQLRRDLGLVGSDRPMYGPSVNIMLFDYDLRIPHCTTTMHNVSAGMIDDLVFNLYDRSDGAGPILYLDGHPDAYTSTDLTTHLARFRTFLRALLATPDRPVRGAELLLPGEQELLRTWGSGAQQTWPEATVVDLFASCVDSAPATTALVVTQADSAVDVSRPAQVLTYGELGARAAVLGSLLADRGAGAGRVVAVLLPRTVDAIAAVFAVLGCGAAYAPLDAGQPDRRLALLLTGLARGTHGLRLAAVITTAAIASRIPGEFRELLVIVDGAESAVRPRDSRSRTAVDRVARTIVGSGGAGSPGAQVAAHDAVGQARSEGAPSSAVADAVAGRARIRSDQPAWLIHTSGTTGTPKAVVITHGSVMNLFQHHRLRMIEPTVAARGGRRMRAALTASLSFDTAWEGMLWLLAGHELHLIDDELRRDPAGLVRYVRRAEIDFLDVTPTFARELLGAGLLAGARRPGVIALGGEAADHALWGELRSVPGTSAYNLYGPTECTVDATWTTLGAHAEPSIGVPITNGRCLVLDSALRPVPPGVVGELYIGGAPVGQGYHADPVATACRFVADPEGSTGARLYRTGDLVRWKRGGHLEYLGRGDSQMSLRGYRIEVGEVEAALVSHPGVAAAAVRIHGDLLVAYLVPVPAGSRIESAQVRVFLAERLPDYLVPSVCVMLDRLPHNANGKLDRSALPAPSAAVTASRPARTAAERELVKLFAEALDRSEVGIDDDFFALGGHSLRAARVLNGIRETFGVRWDLRAMFDTPTVAGLAERLITGATDESPWAGLDLAAEVTLDDTVDATRADPPRPRPRTVLLTGATGFLGAFLLAELLERTDLDVYCLVRANDDAEAAQRIQRTFDRYGLSTDSLFTRVTALAGDLAHAGFGLDPSRYHELTERVDLIVHNGARVHHFESYSRLRPANVEGTERILRLAATGVLKPVHFVSTCDTACAVDGNPPVLTEDRRVGATSLPHNGYVASKWVAEGLAYLAATRGVPVSVYRPGRVGGHSATGAIGPDDAFWSLIRAMVLTEAVPGDVYEHAAVDMVPVDWAAAAIVRLMTHETSGRTYHLTARAPLAFATVVDGLRARGFPIATASSSEWQARLTTQAEQADAQGDHSLTIARAHTAHLGPSAARVRFGRDNTVAALANAPLPPPDSSAALVAGIDHLIRIGFLPAAPEASVSKGCS